MMIVTIDGPAGAGKSSVARMLAARLGFRFLDTGAMYRTMALALLDNGWDDLTHREAAVKTAEMELEFGEDKRASRWGRVGPVAPISHANSTSVWRISAPQRRSRRPEP